MAGTKIDYGQASKSQANPLGEIEALIIRSAMLHGIGHFPQDLSGDASVCAESDFAADAAHRRDFAYRSWKFASEVRRHRWLHPADAAE